MNRNFYLKHSLMAMYDPRMENLLEQEGFKGFGAYWVIMEKLVLLPESCAQFEYLRPFCKSMKVSFAYIKKIILNYGLFCLYEDGYFEPEELNPPRKKEQKIAKKASEYEDSEAKNDEKQQKTSLNKADSKANCLDNSLNNGDLAKNDTGNTKENIKDIITTTTTEKEEKEETAAADDEILLSSETNAAEKPLSSETDAAGKPIMLFRMPKAWGGVCPFCTASEMTHVSVGNDAAHRPKPRTSAPPKCVIWSG